MLQTQANPAWDVAIMGGGLAGLSLSIQLKLKDPSLRIAVIEQESHPVPLAAHKVGEATVEAGGHYFHTVIGMHDHMEKFQILKPGLRFYFTAGDNSDIARRGEFGHSHWPTVAAYQLDRGVFENALGERAMEKGVSFIDNATVADVKLSKGGNHEIEYRRKGQSETVTARWLVDCSGRAAILRRKLGLKKASPHHCGSVWFRIQDEIDIDQWSTDPQWRSRVEPELRRYATNHLMGEGYWVWIIPLSSGATSIGIVVDPDYHPMTELRTFEMALEWLRKFEPQCAKAVEQNLDKVLDFKVLANFSNDCERVYSSDRYLISGVAGPFLDPFYSPGSDFIAMGNTFITDIISRDRAGEDTEEIIEYYNATFLDLFRGALNIYDHQYRIWGNPQVMTCKLTWDYAYYWGVFALLYFNDKFTDPGFFLQASDFINNLQSLSANMQRFFRDWDRAVNTKDENFYIDQFSVDFLYELHRGMKMKHTDEDLMQRIQDNVATCENIAKWMIAQAFKQLHGGKLECDVGTIDPRLVAYDHLATLPAHFSAGENMPQVAGLEKIWVTKSAPQPELVE